MSKAVFPIVEVSENRLVSVDGSVGHFFEIIPPDLEQLTPSEMENFFEGVAKGLGTLDEGEYFKFYRLSGCSYLETAATAPSFPNVSFVPKDRPLKIFFGEDAIFSDIGIYDDYLSYNGQYVRILSVCEFSGEEIGPHYIPDRVDYVLNLRPTPKVKSISRLERIRSGHLGSFLKRKRDISSEGTYQQAEDLLFDLMHGHESLFEMELFFILRAYSLEDLHKNTQALHAELLARGMKTFVEGQSLRKFKSGLACLFNELIPGVRPTLGLRKLVNKSSHLRYLLPLNRSHLMDKGILLHDRMDGPIYFNPFLENIKNRNMLVTGTSGAGKSVFVNKVVHCLIDKHPTVILDKGGSFKRLTLYHQGEVLASGFNPMQFKDPVYLREIILSVVDRDKFGKLEKGKLLKAIKELLPSVSKFHELLAKLEGEFPGISLYFEEIKNHLTNDELEFKSILYVDIDNYPKGIVAPLIIYLLEYFKNLPEKEKILVFDECWSFLKDHASYIDECFRTFRKSGAFPIAISQAVKDFSIFDRELGQAITNNSYFKVYFPQELEAQGELSIFDVENINSLSFEKGVFAECYLKTADNSYRKTIRNYLTALELELFHTEAGGDEKLFGFLQHFGRFFKSAKEAIETYVRLKHEQDKSDFDFFTSFDKGAGEHSVLAR